MIINISNMNKVKIQALLILCMLIFSVMPQTSFAANCPPGITPTNEAVCNPSPQFFVDLTTLGMPDNSFASLFTFIIQGLLAIVGIISLLFIILGGYQYITSRGDEELASSGKKTLTNAIIGLAIVVLSYIVVAVVINALKGDI